MRIAPALTLCAALLAAPAASANPQCALYTKNIAHYELTAERMRAGDKPLWEQKTREHIRTLERQRAEQCPEWTESAQARRLFGEMMRLAGKAALTYFTMGLY